MGNSKNNIENKDVNLIKAFAQRSRMDLDSAISLLNSKNYADAAYHAQQCAEKIIKCVLIIHNRFVRTHLVSGIFDEVILAIDSNKWRDELKEIVPFIIELEKHWILPRYPEPYGDKLWNPIKEYTEKDASEAIAKAEFVLTTITKFIKEVYEIEV